LPPFIEKASAYALENCESRIYEFKKEFENRRNIILEKIEEIDSLTPNKIEGAFYAFPSYKLKTGSIDLSKRILQKKNLALLPGSAFGERGEGRLRLSFSGPVEELEDGMKRLKDFFDSP
ncbi:MAG TPA: aminotransferase class I/II-fold pyridoxal phosphate-dependent enzyme, partial [Nitrososphaerales archaeon]|nr:aminotransferase class I/II-fold pyridoxal phosphate-dependent enzyme [Nitrososphaerales archaeon]